MYFGYPMFSESTPRVPEVHKDRGGDEQAAGGHSQEEGQAQPALLRHLRQGNHSMFSEHSTFYSAGQRSALCFVMINAQATLVQSYEK